MGQAAASPVCVPFYHRRVNKRIAILSTLWPGIPSYAIDIEDYKTEFVVSLRKARECAREQTEVAQYRQKKLYDRKCQEATYKVGERVMVYMPIDASGKDRKLACPYHEPYRILAVTPTNA